MKLPKIIVIYSPIYDQIISGKLERIEKSKFQEKFRKVPGFIFSKELQRRLNVISKKILTAMSKITELSWLQDKIIIYPVSKSIPFNEPLTVEIWKNWKYQIDTFTHEMAHNLVWNSMKQQPRISYKKIIKKYPKEAHNVILHIPIMAIVKLTLEKVFGEKAHQYYKYEYKKWSKRSEVYIRAWKIMEKEGAKNIIEMIKK
jgi:hypothetical protein